MKNDNIGCFGWFVVLAALAFGIWRTYELIAADIPLWLKFALIG